MFLFAYILPTKHSSIDREREKNKQTGSTLKVQKFAFFCCYNLKVSIERALSKFELSEACFVRYV